LINPRYGSAIRLDITQPLLKNFGPKVSRREILMAEDSLDVSRDQLKNVMLETIYLVEEAYWTLVYAIEDYKVKERSLQLGRNLLAKNKKEVEFGQLAPLEILNAEAVVASREADILQAEALIKRYEEVLKTIINVAAEGEVSSQRIVPSDKPDFVAREISRDQCLREALDSRPDLRVLKKTIETKDLNLSVARNQTLPGLDLQFSYWSPGLSGDRLIYENDSPLLGVVIGKEKGSRYDSLRDSLKLLYKNWTIGLTLSLPLSNFLSRAELAYARTDLSQAQTKLKNLEQQVILEVSDAVRSIETNARRVHAYRLARELSEKRLEAEEKKLAVGLSTNYFVLEFQEQLANAQSAELKALVDYNLSLARLEKATGQGLESRRILGSPPEK
jgi:outer membrane protein TolC